MTEQKEFVDFNVGLGDNGEDNLAAIQPLSDGEGASQVIFRRPSENLRERTETLRDIAGELLYYRDYSHLMIEYTGGTITWNGAAPGAPPLGKISVTAGNFTVTPMLAPYQAKKGTLSVGTPASNQVIYTVAAASYATHGMNAVTIKHLHSASAVSVTVTISAGPVKRIVVTLNTSDVTHTAAAVQTALAIAIAADTALAGRLTITTSAVPGVAAIALAETRLDTTADDEKHVIAGSDIQTLTTTTPLQPGMGVAIWYKYVIEPAGFGADPKGGLAGGRAESSGDRGTSTIPAAALFVTHVSPDKIPGAIPLCRVGYNGQLIWYDGTRLEAGESFQFKSPTSVAALALSSFTTTLAGVTGGALVGYNGSGFWADGVTAVTASTMETAVDEVVADLAAFTATSPGAIRIGVDSPTIFSGSPITAIGAGGASTAASGTVRSALDQLDSAVVARRGFTAVCTDGVASVGGDYNAATLFASMNTLGSGKYFARRGAYTTAVDLSTVYGASLIGEAQGLVTLAASTSVKLVASDAAAVNEFENVYFTVSSATAKYNLAKHGLNIKNCRAQAGVFTLDYVASSVPTRVSIDGLLVDTDNSINADNAMLVTNAATAAAPITGNIKNLQIRRVNSLNAAGTAQRALNIEQLGTAGTNTDDALTFENCIIDPSTGFGVAAGSVLRIAQSYQTLIFRGCLIRCSQATVTPLVLEIISSTNIVFEDCKIVQEGNGKLFSITGTSSGIKFVRTEFYTSPGAALSREIEAYCDEISSTVPTKDIVFEDCYISIRRGDGSVSNRIELGQSAGTSVGVGGISVDGLFVDLTYTNTTNIDPDLFNLSTGLSYRSVASVRNLSFDFRGKRLFSGTRIVDLRGELGAMLDVDGIHLKNVSEPLNPGIGNDVATAVRIYDGHIRSGSVNGTPAVSNVSSWKGIFDVVGDGSSVDGVRFWECGTPNKGRLIHLSDDRTAATNNKVNVVNLASGENTQGWFCRTNQLECFIHANTILITGTVGSLTGGTEQDAFILLQTNADQCVVSNNIIRSVSDVTGITLDACDYCSVIGNTIRSTAAAGPVDVIVIMPGATRNTIVGNTGFNTDGGFGTQIIDGGTSTVQSGNSMEP
jgi:hypothetical protein